MLGCQYVLGLSIHVAATMALLKIIQGHFSLLFLWLSFDLQAGKEARDIAFQLNLGGTKLASTLNTYKSSVFFVGHMQTIQTQIRRRNMRSLIRIFTVCLQNVPLKFE